MKIGLIVSALVLILVTIVTIMALNPPPDRPTRRTMGDQLQARQLTVDAAALLTPANADADATGIYEEAFELYRAHPNAFQRKPPDPQKLREATNLFIKAADAGRVDDGWLDRKITLKPGYLMDDRLEPVGQLPISIIEHAWAISGEPELNVDRAIEECKAVYAFGYRCYARNELFEPRYMGLIVIENAADQLCRHYKDQPEKVAQFAEVRDDAKRLWSAMDDQWNYLHESPPPIGDLLNVAANHEDLGFRVGATLRLGIAKLQPKHRGNRKAILSMLNEFKTSSEPLIAQAAEASLEYRP